MKMMLQHRHLRRHFMSSKEAILMETSMDRHHRKGQQQQQQQQLPRVQQRCYSS